MKNSILLILLIIVVIFSCKDKKNMYYKSDINIELTFVRMDSLEPADTKDTNIDRYIVSGFRKSKRNYTLIDSFVCENIDTNKIKYRDYFILFFRKSKKTSNEYLKKVPREFYRYSLDNDIICSYTWRNGVFFPKEIYPTFDNDNSIDIDTLVCKDTIFVFPY